MLLQWHNYFNIESLIFLFSIQPVGSQILSNIQIAGHSWNLWRGPNANWQVLSFVSANGEIRDFNVDLNDFFRKSFLFCPTPLQCTHVELSTIEYLIENQGVAPTQVRRIAILIQYGFD